MHDRPLLSATIAVALLGSQGCQRPELPPPPPQGKAAVADDLRTRAAAVTLRFDNGRSEPGNLAQAQDRLQVAAVFADVDRRDLPLLLGLVGQPGAGGEIDAPDTCVRQTESVRPLGTGSGTRPNSWMQLLDVGNLELLAGEHKAPLSVQLVPAVIESARGVRYDLAIDQSRTWLAAGRLTLRATGGDGVAPFEATVGVPRPVRITHVGQVAAQQGVVQGVPSDEPLRLRWGSVDGTAELELMVGSEEPGALGWLRCNLKDDGEFVVPPGLTAQLPPRSARRSWLVVLVRRTSAAIPGFAAKAMRLELADSVHVR